MNNLLTELITMLFVEQSLAMFVLLIGTAILFMTGGKSPVSKNLSPNLLYTIHPILVCLKVLILYYKLSDQEILRLVES